MGLSKMILREKLDSIKFHGSQYIVRHWFARLAFTLPEKSIN